MKMKRNDFVVHSRSRRFFKNDKILLLGKVFCEKDNNILGRHIEISNIGEKEYGYSKSSFHLYNLGRKDKFRILYSNELFWTGLNIVGELKKLNSDELLCHRT